MNEVSDAELGVIRGDFAFEVPSEPTPSFVHKIALIRRLVILIERRGPNPAHYRRYIMELSYQKASNG
jgi:hypothetical protein